MERPLHIGMIIDAYDDSKNGAVISTQRFTAALREYHRVTVVTTGVPEDGKVILPRFYAPFVDRTMRKMKTPLAIPLRGRLRKWIPLFDVIHVQFPFTWASGKSLPHPPIFLTLNSEELVAYYNMADLYIHAAEVEVECMSALEAMACGLPLLIADSRKSATRQFALDERSLFASGDLSSLVQRMEYWIDHPEELALAREHYLIKSRQFRFELSVEALQQVYASVVSSPKHVLSL